VVSVGLKFKLTKCRNAKTFSPPFRQSSDRRERPLERGHRRVAAQVRRLHRQQHATPERRRRRSQRRQLARQRHLVRLPPLQRRKSRQPLVSGRKAEDGAEKRNEAEKFEAEVEKIKH